MRKAILITIGIIAALGITTWYIANQPSKQSVTPWQLVPNETLAVFETEQPLALQKLDADSAKLTEFLLTNDSLKSTPEPWLFAIQPLGTKTGIVALLKKTRKTTPLEKARSLKDVSLRERSHEGIPVTDVVRNNQSLFTIAQLRGVWIVSPHGQLVEGIIRNHKSEHSTSFRKSLARVFQLANVKQDDGNLYINWRNFRNATTKSTLDPLLQASALCDAMIFDLRWSGSNLLMNGFAVDSTTNAGLLSIFRSQRPVPFDLKTRLPDQFRYLVHFGISNPPQWLIDRQSHLSKEDIDIAASLQTLSDKTGFNPEAFFKAIDNEVAFCAMPSSEKVIVVELKEITRAQAELVKIHHAAQKDNNYTSESYAEQEIHILPQSTLGRDLFWPISLPSNGVHYAIVDNLMVLAESEQGIKKFIDNLPSENILSKNLQWSKFLEMTLPEANVSYFVASDNDALFKPLRVPQRMGMQFYALEGDYYASAVLQFRGSDDAKKNVVRSASSGVEFSSLASSPIPVINHTDRSTEVIFVDASNQLHLVSKDMKELWSVQLPGPALGSIYQVDLLKNGKLQFLVTTSGSIHVIDRLGRYVAGYPKKISMKDIAFTSLVDYDKSRNYRLLTASTAGVIQVVDMDGKPLEGWTSKTLPRQFSDAPTHYRIQQRDYYEATTVHGELYLYTRRGEIVNGFPLSLGFTPSGDVASDGTGIYLVSSDGTLVKINTQGKKEMEEALLKKSTTAAFRLIASSNSDQFLIVKTDQGFFASFDKKGKQLFEINNPVSDQAEVSLFHAPDNRDVLVVFDREQGIFFACDGTGKLLIPRPLPATAAPAVVYSSSSKSITFITPDQKKLVAISATF